MIKLKEKISNINIINIAYLCIIAVQLYVLFSVPIYQYIIKTKEFKTMLIEIVCFVFVQIILNRVLKEKKRVWSGILLLIIFGYLHQTILSLGISLIYFGILIGIGFLVLSIIVETTSVCLGVRVIVCLLLGMCVTCFDVSVLSIIQRFSIRNIWIVLVAEFVILGVVQREKIKKTIKCRNRGIYIDSQVLTMLEISLLIQLGRVGLQADYDGMWYGLRSLSVLANSNKGIFEDLKLVGFTYLYPKGAEIILLPLSKFNSWNAMFLFNVLLVLVIGFVVGQFATRLVNEKIGKLLAVTVVTIPAVMNMAMTVKPDIITALFQISGIYIAYVAFKEKRAECIYYALACFAFTYCFKVTSLLFTTAIVIGIMPFINVRWFYKVKKETIILLFSVISLLFVWGRTFLITGSPLIVYVGRALKKIGIDLNYPYAIIDNLYSAPAENQSIFQKIIHVLYGYFVIPFGEDYSHIIIAWGTSFPLYILLIAMVFAIAKKDKNLKWMWLVGVLIAVMLFSAMVMGSLDGNYFILFYILFILTAGCYVVRCDKKYKSILYIVIIYNLIIASVTNWSWTTGFTPICVNKVESYSSKDRINQKFISKNGKKIYKKLQKKHKKVLSVSWDIKNLVSIAGPSEMWLDIQGGNCELISDPAVFASYLEDCGFDYILYDKETVAVDSMECIYVRYLIEYGFIKNIRYGKNAAILTIGNGTDEMEQLSKFDEYLAQ